MEQKNHHSYPEGKLSRAKPKLNRKYQPCASVHENWTHSATVGKKDSSRCCCPLLCLSPDLPEEQPQEQTKVCVACLVPPVLTKPSVLKFRGINVKLIHLFL
jgi:hypothetical protein